MVIFFYSTTKNLKYAIISIIEPVYNNILLRRQNKPLPNKKLRNGNQKRKGNKNKNKKNKSKNNDLVTDNGCNIKHGHILIFNYSLI